MRRRDFIGLLGGAAAAWPAVATGQQTRNLARVGYLSDELDAAHALGSYHSVLERLHERGYIDGRDIQIDYRSAEENYEKLPSLAAELAALPVDVILAIGTPAAKAAIAVTKTIPIVFARSGDPVGYGLVSGLARPGGNATGFSVFVTELAAKRLQVLKDLVPGLDRLAVVYESIFPVSVAELNQLVAAAPSAGLQIQAVGVRDLAALNGNLPEVLAKEPPGALFVGSSILFEDHPAEVLQFVTRARLPALYVREGYVEAGGLASYGVSYREMYHGAADYLIRILKGAKPADLPVQLPSKVNLVINLRTANMLGLAMAPSLLARADEVIE
jgi:putative tryptophan/tyrosine transport system substrate-binding protein